MIPKDTFSNLYLGIYQAENEKEGWTVRRSRSDCPDAPGGLSARAGRTVRAACGEEGGTGCSGVNNGPSAPGRRTVRAPRGLSAGAS
jgi:hypothetical protein